MSTISLECKRPLQWDICDSYGELSLTEEVINYGKLQVDCDIDAKCRVYAEPGYRETFDTKIEVSNMKVYNEDGEEVTIEAQQLKEISNDIKQFIYNLL